MRAMRADLCSSPAKHNGLTIAKPCRGAEARGGCRSEARIMPTKYGCYRVKVLHLPCEDVQARSVGNIPYSTRGLESSQQFSGNGVSQEDAIAGVLVLPDSWVDGMIEVSFKHIHFIEARKYRLTHLIAVSPVINPNWPIDLTSGFRKTARQCVGVFLPLSRQVIRQ